MLGKRVNSTSPPLTNYFKPVPSATIKTENKENIMPLRKVKREKTSNGYLKRSPRLSISPIVLASSERSEPYKRRQLGSTGSSLCSPTDCIIVISSDEEGMPPRKIRPHARPTLVEEIIDCEESEQSLTIKELFDDSVKSKPMFPPINDSTLPNFLKAMSPAVESSDSGSSDHELPSVFQKPKKLFPLSPETKLSLGKLKDTKPLILDSEPCSKFMTPPIDKPNLLFLSSPPTEPVPCLPEEIFEEETPVTSPLQPTKELDPNSSDRLEAERSTSFVLEQLEVMETKEQSVQVMISCCGLVAKDCPMDSSVRVCTSLQEKKVDHYLTLCMASPSMRLFSAVSYLKMVTTPVVMPSSVCLLRLWRALLDDKVQSKVAESCVRYISSLLLIHPPYRSVELREQYSQLIRGIRSDDLLDLLVSSVSWKVDVLEYVCRVLLLDYHHLVRNRQECPPLFRQVFWSYSSPLLVNQTVRKFLRATMDILETDISVLMAKRLEVCCQFLFLIQSCCDLSHEISIILQQAKQSLTPPSKLDLFLALLHPLKLVCTVYKDTRTL